MNDELPPIGSTVRLDDGTVGEVYRHEYDLEELADGEIHVMTLDGDGQYGRCLTCHVEEVTVLD